MMSLRRQQRRDQASRRVLPHLHSSTLSPVPRNRCRLSSGDLLDGQYLKRRDEHFGLWWWLAVEQLVRRASGEWTGHIVWIC
jgi:hypothetical protein